MELSTSHRGSCSIVTCTLALRERAQLLKRAIASVSAGNECAPRSIVVVNGDRFDRELVLELHSRPDIQLIQIPAASSPLALLAGRQAVTTPFFGFLDDDDEYLPGAVDARLECMHADPEASVVVTNGFNRVDGMDVLTMNRLSQVAPDPLMALFRENWMASCGGLFRAEHVPAEFFEDLPRHIHWSWLAFRLAEAGKRVITLDEPMFRINDTVGSSSKSDTYLLCHVEVYQRMLASASRPEIAEILNHRLSQAWHEVSNFHRRKGAYRAAWAAHLRSLSHPSGWKFIPYTRKLILPVGVDR